ncbi:MAG: phosphoenolpyruvate carboxylase [Armatimonas sp.]
MVPGWFGLGSALEAFASSAPGHLGELQTMYREWLFFKTVIDNAQMELLRAHLPTAKRYALRAPHGAEFHARLEAEHARTVEWVKHVTGSEERLGARTDCARYRRSTKPGSASTISASGGAYGRASRC